MKTKKTMLLWFLVPALFMAGAIFGWILLMGNVKNSGGSAMLFTMMYYASLPVALGAMWIGLHVTEYITSQFTYCKPGQADQLK